MSNKPTVKPNQPSHLKDLGLLFAIPIGIAILAAAAVYTPRLFAHPKYDFIYSVCTNFDCSYDYDVSSSGYIASSGTKRDYYNGTATLRYYTAKDDSTRSLTLDQAKDYPLYTSSKSPDGYTVTKADSSTSAFFWSSSDNGWYLKNGPKKKKVELSIDGSSYSPGIKFLGWVIKNAN